MVGRKLRHLAGIQARHDLHGSQIDCGISTRRINYVRFWWRWAGARATHESARRAGRNACQMLVIVCGVDEREGVREYPLG